MNRPQPSDSFFTTINTFDQQVRHFQQVPCEELIEASTRRLAELKGPVYAAVRTQRIADICAGVHVMPIEYWNQKAKPADQPERGRVKKEPRYLLRAASLLSFGIGWLAGHFFSIVIQHILGAQ